MGVEYTLVNQTKKESISFAHLNGSKMRELAGNAVQSAIVTWYLLNNQGDQIQFVSDAYNEWPFASERVNEPLPYPDKTDVIIRTLIEADILQDNGMLYVCEVDPDVTYTRDIVNVWADRS